MSRFLKPEVVRIDLTQGDWILIKRELTAGEQRRVFARTAKSASVKQGEEIEIDIEKAGLANMVEFLVDWSLTDPDGKPVVIRDAGHEFVSNALNNLDADSYNEIAKAINEHETKVSEEKKARSTVTA